MTLNEVISQYWGEGVWIVVIISSLIEFTPVKFAPISWILKKIGNVLNSDLTKKIDKIENDVKALDNKLEQHIQCNNENVAIEKRLRILQFADYIQNGANSSQSHFEQILNDINDYNKYCEEHPDFKNGITVHNAKYIENVYDEKLKNNSFL